MRRAIEILVVLSGVTGAAAAQVTRIEPDVRLGEEFASIRGVRELPSGQVLVSDYRDQRVVLVDFASGTVTDKVRRGGGPREARLPTALVPARGDSTLLIDLGNQRVLVLDPKGEPRRTIPGDQPGVMGVRGVDPAGRYYLTIPGWMERGGELPDDSVRLVRLDPATGRTEPVTQVQGERFRSDRRSPSMVPRIPIVGYGSSDGWALGPDGTLWIVRGGDYHVDVLRPGSAPVAGPSYAYQTRRVTSADREAFVRRFNASAPSSGRGEDGAAMGFSPPMSDRDVAEMTARTEFAERHPMFLAGSVIADPLGSLWVGLPAESRQPTRYDVFDRSGRRTRTVELPAGRRLMAVGRAHLYAAAENEDGLQYLERYPLPR
ncbi:MAG: hypothetical protein AB7R55_16770 [Gemmatimonadales bacterium]